MTHSAGLPRESDYPYWVGPDFIFPTRNQIKEELGSQSTLYPADRYYQYSNLGLSLVGEIVAEKSGEDYDSYVRKHILIPLKMADTDTGFPTDSREPRIATGYAYPGRGDALKVMPRYNARGITPAAGFASTALDLARFASWQFRVRSGASKEVLAANTLREMQRVQWMDWDWKVARGLAIVSLPTMEPVKNMVLLKHVEGDRFRTIRSDDEPGHELLFRRDDSGKITHLDFHSISLPRM